MSSNSNKLVAVLYKHTGLPRPGYPQASVMGKEASWSLARRREERSSGLSDIQNSAIDVLRLTPRTPSTAPATTAPTTTTATSTAPAPTPVPKASVYDEYHKRVQDQEQRKRQHLSRFRQGSDGSYTQHAADGAPVSRISRDAYDRMVGHMYLDAPRQREDWLYNHLLNWKQPETAPAAAPQAATPAAQPAQTSAAQTPATAEQVAARLAAIKQNNATWLRDNLHLEGNFKDLGPMQQAWLQHHLVANRESYAKTHTTGGKKPTWWNHTYTHNGMPIALRGDDPEKSWWDRMTASDMGGRSTKAGPKDIDNALLRLLREDRSLPTETQLLERHGYPVAN